jgi:hypothetical protein
MMEVRPFSSTPLPLATDGALELFFLGVGAAFTKRQYQTNLLIRKGPDHLMVDFGAKAPQAAHEVGLRVTDLTCFYITHSHADHVGGLEEVALSHRYISRSRPRMYITQGYEERLWTETLLGGCAANEDPPLRFSDYFDVHRPKPLDGMPRESYGFRVGGIEIAGFRTMHVPDSATHWRDCAWSTGVVIDGRVLFTGDTRFDPELLLSFDRVYDIEHIFQDCQFFTGGVHAGVDELVTLPPAIKKRMHLTHYGDNWEAFEDRIRESGFAGRALQRTIYRF